MIRYGKRTWMSASETESVESRPRRSPSNFRTQADEELLHQQPGSIHYAWGPSTGPGSSGVITAFSIYDESRVCTREPTYKTRSALPNSWRLTDCALAYHYSQEQRARCFVSTQIIMSSSSISFHLSANSSLPNLSFKPSITPSILFFSSLACRKF